MIIAKAYIACLRYHYGVSEVELNLDNLLIAIDDIPLVDIRQGCNIFSSIFTDIISILIKFEAELQIVSKILQVLDMSYVFPSLSELVRKFNLN